MSSVPATLSSVELSGSSTTLIGTLSTAMSSCLSSLPRQYVQNLSGLDGSQLNGQPETTSLGGSTCSSDLTVVDLAVPFSPLIRAPPMLGSTMFRSRARFMFSWPTIATNGNSNFSMSKLPWTILPISCI